MNTIEKPWELLVLLESIADIINDCWENIKRNTKLPNISQKIVRDGSIYGIGIAKVMWNQSINNGLGDIRIERLSPLDFYPEPQATSIENCNYIFVKRVISRFDLINQYKNKPEILKIIDELSTPSKQIVQGEQTNEVLTAKTSVENTEMTQQMFVEKGGMPSGTEHNIELIECYLKDDTVLISTEKESPQDEKMKQTQRFKYQNGRMIIFSGKHILEDRPIDYPFGFPFSIYNPIQSDTLFGHGDVEDIMMIQRRLTDAYAKLNELLQKYKSQIVTTKKYAKAVSGNFDIIALDPGDTQIPFQQITNKLTQDIAIVRQHIQDLKQDAYKIARINEIMLSGERPTGVNSGKMVRDLIESPMSSIREMQRNFKNFLEDISNKAIVLIQLYYNQPRIIRMSSGSKFAAIEQDANGQMIINVYDQNMEDDQLYNIETIKSDLTLGEFEIEITAGSSLPQSQSAVATTTMQLAQQGIFGDTQNPDVKELILKTLDYPNYRAIINKIKEEQDEQAQIPAPEPDFNTYIKNVKMSLKDITDLVSVLPLDQQIQTVSTIMSSLGLGMPSAPIESMPNIESMPIEQNNTPIPQPNFIRSVG